MPERFGIGWTINFARPAAWILIGCFLAADVLCAIAVMLLWLIWTLGMWRSP